MLQTMLSALWNLIITNWKTTAAGLAIALVYFAEQFGLQIPAETKQALITFLVSLGLISSKDGNKF